MEYLNLPKILPSNGVFTCLSLPLILYAFNFQDSYYSIGKYQSLPLIAALICSETTKAIYNYFRFSNLSDRENFVRNKKSSQSFSIREAFKVLSLNLIMAGAFYVIAVLFGAPIFLKQEETLMFSILLTVLTVLPSCLYLGCDNTLLLISNFNSYYGNLSHEVVLLSMRLTVFGAWLGAIVIPLDWDRPWQEWPIPCCLGALFGYLISQVVFMLIKFPGLNRYLTKSSKFGV